MNEHTAPHPAAELGANSYGKDEIRLVKVEREAERHQIRDLTVSTVLAGDFTASYLLGDNSAVLPTDTQKNTVHALAAEPFGAIEELGVRLAAHFTTVPSVREARIRIEEHPWRRLETEHGPADAAFANAAEPIRIAWITTGPRGTRIEAGVRGIKVLKSAGSEFHGFLKDRYTTLAETRDRILATEIDARWLYRSAPAGLEGTGPGTDWTKTHDAVLANLLKAFADTHSLAVQQSLHAMGSRVIETVPEVDEISIRLPNLHHIPVNLAALGLPGRDGIYTVLTNPYGVIEGTVHRADAEADPQPQSQPQESR